MLLQVSTSMKDLCHDVFGIAKEKKDAREVTTNRGKSIFHPALDNCYACIAK